MTQKGLDGGSKKGRARAVAADIGDKIGEHVVVERENVVKISPCLFERAIVDGERSFRAILRPNKDRLLGVPEFFEVGLLLADQRAVIFANPQVDANPGQTLHRASVRNVVDSARFESLDFTLQSSSRKEDDGNVRSPGVELQKRAGFKAGFPGIMTSSRMRSGRLGATNCRAMGPFSAAMVRNPRLQHPLQQIQFIAVSSTTSILGAPGCTFISRR